MTKWDTEGVSSEMEGWEPERQHKLGFLETGLHERALAEGSDDLSYSLRGVTLAVMWLQSRENGRNTRATHTSHGPSPVLRDTGKLSLPVWLWSYDTQKENACSKQN